MKTKTLFAVFLLVCIASIAFAGNVPNPKVTGPIPVNTFPGDPSHDYVYFTPVEDLASYGYVEEEFFITGFANEYDTPTGQTGEIKEGTSPHPYKTRMVVRRPVDPKKFNGVVLLEWQNVSAGYELDAHWAPSWKHFVDKGYIWVGISAQRVGVHGNSVTEVDNGLVDWSPIRYGTLDVTDGGTVLNDALCYDILSQAAQALKAPEDVDPVAGMPVEMVIAIGASQSASRLSIYHNSIHPLHEVVDGYFLLVGGSGLRTDLSVKVFQNLSETDVGFRGPAVMEDSDHFRSWEVTGAAHSGYTSKVYRDPIVIRDFEGEQWPPNCAYPPYSRVESHHVINIQYDHLVRWIRDDIAPPVAPKIAFTEGTYPRIMRDELGIAVGGIRLPEIDVPVALNNGVNYPLDAAPFCYLYGTYSPFNDEMIASLYRNHGSYVSAVVRCAKENKKAGYILQESVAQYTKKAAHTDVGKK